ncbi:LysR family transcriptional regulator [Telluribacter humicola]|uniref:LysR family transcriptional regulator n=1 Tax=Telluribacter humicola TaxID=1720261 RepID=UPI001A96BA7A|nr:LysR family transcriptional regulator [Telluribacter humicola]
MNYTLHQLQVFLKITQTQSITKAAEELYLTQPAVSIQLRNLQDQFEIPLTEVVGRKLYITDFGQEIAVAAERILNEVHAINYKTLAYKGQLTGRLKVSVVSTGKYVMPYFLADFLKQHEGVELVMDVTNKSRVIESLERNEVDFSLVSVLPDNLPLQNVELMPNKLCVVANTEAQYQDQPYDWSIFENLPLIYREKGSGTRSTMEKFFESNGIKVRQKLELTSNEAVKQAVVAGLGCSIMPIIGLKNELLNRDLQIIPVRDFPISTTWQLVWMKNKNLSPVADSLLNYLKQEKNRIIQDKFKWTENY